MTEFQRIRRKSDQEFELTFKGKSFQLKGSPEEVNRWFDAFSRIQEQLGEDASYTSEQDRVSPTQQVLRRINESKQERKFQSSPTSPLHLGSSSDTSDSRPESAEIHGCVVTATRQEAISYDGDAYNRDDDNDDDDDDDDNNDNDTRRMSPRALLAMPSKAFGEFFLNEQPAIGDTGTYVRGLNNNSAEQTRVLTFHDERGEASEPSPSQCNSTTICPETISNKTDLFTADKAWIDESWDSEDDSVDEDELHPTHNMCIAETKARRSLKMDNNQATLYQGNAYGSVLPDKNWIEEDFDSDDD